MMLNRKNKLLVFGFFIALLICYQFAISKTLNYYNEYTTQKELITANLNDPKYLEQLIKKEKQLNLLLKEYNTSTDDSFQNNLLKQISILSAKYALKITDFNEPHTFVEKDNKTLSYVFSVEGSFNNTLLLINRLENVPSLGFVKHIAFTKKRNYKNNTDYLTTEIMLQKNESGIKN